MLIAGSVPNCVAVSGVFCICSSRSVELVCDLFLEYL